MYRPLDCIALRTVRYSDRNSILTAYTRQAGRLSFLVPAGTGRAFLNLDSPALGVANADGAV